MIKSVIKQHITQTKKLNKFSFLININLLVLTYEHINFWHLDNFNHIDIALTVLAFVTTVICLIKTIQIK